MKKTLFLLSILLSCSCIFAHGEEIDSIFYTFNTSDHTATVTSCKKKSSDITIPEIITYNSRAFKVTSIGNWVFSGCTGLTSIIIPNSVTSIGNYAFKGCTGLTKITIPNSVTNIEAGAFSGCTGLTSIIIPNSVISIGSNAFSGCTGLTSITIGNSVKNIGSSAFSGCTGLTSIIIPNSVTSIEKNAFNECTGLTSVTIGNSVTSIGEYAFYKCTGLTSITIPNSVESIEDYAFDHTSLKECYINVIDFSKGNFHFNPTIKAHYLYEGKEISGAFAIPDSVTTIGSYALYNCSGLTSITIPSSVTSIGDYAFYYCDNLTTVISLMPNPPSWISEHDHSYITNLFSSKTFYGTLYVPIGSEAAYRNSVCWRQFYDIIEGIPDDIDNICTLSVGASNGGSLSFSGKTVEGSTTSLSVESGSAVTLSIIPNEGYRVASLVVNGNDVTADIVDDKYTLEDISEDTSVVATFEIDKFNRAKMDTNDDGEVNSADVVRIYNYIITGE